MSDSTPPVSPYATVTPLSPADEKLWATLIHVGGIFFGFVPALIGYIALKDRGPFIHQHAATALNFQITLAIAYVVGYVTTLILVGFFVLTAAAIVAVVFSIVAAIAANRGEGYRYPLAITFVN